MEEQKYFYVALFHTPFGTGRLIRAVTGFYYNHTGVSFSPEMKYVYAYTRIHRDTPWYAGISVESMRRYLCEGESRLKVFRIPVSSESYYSAKEYIGKLLSDPEEYVYNFVSALGFLFRKTVKIENSFTCVEFVIHFLRKFAGIPTLPQEGFLTVEDLYNILLPYEILECDPKTLAKDASWHGDRYAEEKSRLLSLKKGVKYNAKMLSRFIRGKK